jgi:hypothetical protein
MSSRSIDLYQTKEDNIQASPSDQYEAWMDSLSAALLGADVPHVSPDAPKTVTVSPGEGVVDIGKVILQLTTELAQAKSEADRERALRLSFESETKNLIDSLISIDDTTNVSLEQCLRYVSSLPPHMQEAVYISYNESSGTMVGNFILSDVRAVLKPHDVPGLLFALMTDSSSSPAVSPPASYTEMVPFSIDNLHVLLSGNSPVDDVNAGLESLDGYYMDNYSPMLPPSPSSGTMPDDQPRLNLIEALDVQSDEDIKRIVTVRKCHKLGFKSHVFLKQYFSKFGLVERVVLLPMRAKAKPGMMNDFRNTPRPSSMGFVVMANEESVEKILAFDNASGLHIVKGWPIEVRNFVRPADKPGMPSSAPPAVVPSSSSTLSW